MELRLKWNKIILAWTAANGGICLLLVIRLILTHLVSCTVSEIQPSIGLKSQYLATSLAFNSPDGGVALGRSPWNFLSMSTDGRDTKRRRKIAKNFYRLSRVHERYRQATDDRQTNGRQHIANVNASSRSLKSETITVRLSKFRRKDSSDCLASEIFRLDH